MRKLLLLPLAGLLIFGAIALSTQGCYYDKEQVLYPTVSCDTTHAMSYTTNIVPILNQYCNTCHAASAGVASTLLDSYAAVKTQVDNGQLQCSIEWGSGCQPMPQNQAKLSNCNIAFIDKWIRAGAPNN